MNRRVLVAILLVIAAAGGAWWWGHARSAHRPAAAAATAGSAQLGGARERAQRSGEVAGQARVMIDDEPRGTLRLEGQVVDADDHPVAGATVAITAFPPRRATSEADGSFAFDGLVARPYTLIARAPQGVAGPVTAPLTEKSDPVVLRLRRAGKLTVAVVGASGAPVAGATVELRGIDVQRATADGKPAVFAPVVPGPYQIAAWADGMARAFQVIQISAGDAQARLVLASGAPVRGRVVDDRGAGIGDARVRYSGASDWSQQANARLDGAVTAADGSFAFDALPAGSFRFIATHPERAPATSALVTLDGKTARDGVVIAMEVGAAVRGRVVDAQHHPVASARVRIGGAADQRRMQLEAPRQAFSDAQGAFEIKGLPRKALSAVALHETGSSQTVAVDTTRGDVAELVLAIEMTGTISGKVVDPQGQPVEGAQVTAGPSFAGGRGAFDASQWRLRGLPDAVSDAAGKFTLTGLAPGQYRIAAAMARARGPGIGGRGLRDGVTASTGDNSVVLVLQPDGGVKGRVAFSDGTVPGMFTVSVQQIQQTFGGGDGSFVLDGIAPATYEVSVRGPSFQTRSVEIAIEAAKTADAGTIVVVKGRSIAGVVVADGQPVPGATVYAGRTVFGNGTTSAAQPGPAAGGLAGAFAGGTKNTTTDEAGAFSLSGFGDGDLTLVAEQDAIGRSRALRLPQGVAGQAELVLSLEKFGALKGVLQQGGKSAEGIVVTCQSTSTPGAVYAVAAGADSAYRFDRLAPDVYKVSATLGQPFTGMRFYSKQIEVPAGQEVTADLAVDPGTIELDLAITARSGTLGITSAWLVGGLLSATNASDLSLKIAAAGAGTSQRVVARGADPARFTAVAPGNYSACATPYPAEVRGTAVFDYVARHSDALPAFCKPIVVAPAPNQQTAEIAVDVPPFIPDPGAGSGSGGPGSGSGSGRGSSR